MSNTKFYIVWRNMKRRCLNPKDRKFKDYGGRGIMVCDRWMNFHLFKEDMYPGYGENVILDRIDVNGNYEPANCRWATIRESNENTRLTRRFAFMGKEMTLPRWADQLGLKRSTLEMRIYQYGWSVEKALSTPVGVLAGGRGGASL